MFQVKKLRLIKTALKIFSFVWRATFDFLVQCFRKYKPGLVIKVRFLCLRCYLEMLSHKGKGYWI